jgi:hypothetical protein
MMKNAKTIWNLLPIVDNPRGDVGGNKLCFAIHPTLADRAAATRSYPGQPYMARTKVWHMTRNRTVLINMRPEPTPKCFIKSKSHCPIWGYGSILSKLGNLASCAWRWGVSELIGISNAFSPTHAAHKPKTPAFVNVVQFKDRNWAKALPGKIVNVLRCYQRSVNLILHNISLFDVVPRPRLLKQRGGTSSIVGFLRSKSRDYLPSLTLSMPN